MKKSFLNCCCATVVATLCVFCLTACSSEPFVSRWMTVEDFNGSQEFAAEIVERDYGYHPKCFWASTYYQYVLFDDNKQCVEGGCFCTESDSYDHISPYDRCIKCGRTWMDHDDY